MKTATRQTLKSDMAKTKDFAKFLANQVESDEALADAIERERLNADIAVLIYSEREQAGLTQQELAEKAGTHQSVIARLEDAEYNGRTIELLRRVLHALGRRLAVSAEPLIEDTITAESDPHDPQNVVGY
jgi:ribosome-binding protein aMBF1 (putative translation factor)